MLRFFLAWQLLLLGASLAAGDTVRTPVNASDPLLHRSKRSLFAPNANCPDPVYLTQAQVAAWPGITVDTSQITILDDISKLNLFKCSDDTFFVYTHLPTVMTRANWWLACGPTMSNGWRVRDAGGKNTAYGVIPVGCVKPTCTGLQLFDGSEFVLASYPTYQIVPNQPSLIGINQKFQFTCPLGSTIGIAESSATITLDASMKITCEAEGWWMRTSSNLNGQLLTAKVGCIKTIPALPPTLPTQCQTGITYFTPNTKLTSEGWTYSATTDKAVAANGQWALVCPTSSAIGYVDSSNKVTLDSTIRITCESTGWWIKSASNAAGNALSSGLRVGCFIREKVEYKCATTNLQLFDGSEPIIVSNAAKYQLVPTVPSTVAFVCPSGTTTAYAQLTGDIRLLVEPLSITCESAGWWVKSPLRVDGLLPAVKVGCVKELPSNAVTAPANTLPKQACGCWYERSTCRSCDSQKLFVLDGHGAMSARCTLGCGNGYELEGGENILSCTRGSWIGSSKTGAIGVTVPQSGPFGYIITSCVPTPTVTTCSISPPTFDCLGCDKSKIIFLTPTKSKTGCVLSCDTNYRILVLDTNQKVTRAQEVVAEQGGLFSVYPLGNVNGAIAMSSTVKFSCELATTTTEPVVLNPACTGIQLFDGSESIIAANLATYQFIPTIPSLVAGKLEFVCPTDALVGYAQGDRKLSVEPLKITCESAGWWVKNSIPNRVDGPLGTVRVGCFKELPTTAVAAPASSVPKTPCGCWYEPSSCKSCDLQKLTVLDGVGLSGRCTLGCAKGYMLEGGEMNMLSCQGGYWIGSSRASNDVTVSLFGSFGYITTSCVPAPTPATCAVNYRTFDCVGCDATKLIALLSPKSSAGCVLACDKDYRLVILNGDTVIRAQEAVTNKDFSTVYQLGDVKNPIRMEWTLKPTYSCEPVTADITVPVKVIGSSPATTTSTTSTTTTTQKPSVPPPPVEKCGCPYTADVSNPAHDSTKLFTMASGTNACTLQCDAGYRLAGAKSSASCKDGTWFSMRADNGTHPSYERVSPGVFSCEVAPATCTHKYNIAPCQSGKECSTAAITNIKGAKSNCILSCGRGYQLSVYNYQSKTPYQLYQEAYWDAEAWSGAGGWDGIPLGEPGSTTHYNAPTVLTVNCERYISPSEAARIPSDKEKRLCGCPYDFAGCPTCAYKQLYRIDGFGDFSDNDKCTLACAKGYMFEGGQVNLLSCKKGKGWIGSSRLVNGGTVPMGSGNKVTTSCVPIPAPATCSIQYSTFECGGTYPCYSHALIALSSPKSGCVLSCDSVGYRLIVLDASRTVIRAQEAVLDGAVFKVYPLGDTQTTISIPTNVIKFSCEAAIMKLNPLVPK